MFLYDNNEAIIKITKSQYKKTQIRKEKFNYKIESSNKDNSTIINLKMKYNFKIILTYMTKPIVNPYNLI